MSLPKTEYPLFVITIPSTKKNVNFRRFLTKEEKILLIAKQSDEKIDKLRAMEQVIVNCLMDNTLNIDELTTFDFDYVFLKLRAASVDNIVELRYFDNEDEKEHAVKIDLNKIEIEIPTDIKTTIDLFGDVKMKLKYPTMKQMLLIADAIESDLADNIENKEHNPIEMADLLIEKCIDKIYDSDTVYEDYTSEELYEWLDQLLPVSYDSIKAFLNSIPDLQYKTSYTNSKGSVREVELKGIEDFFTL